MPWDQTQGPEQLYVYVKSHMCTLCIVTKSGASWRQIEVELEDTTKKKKCHFKQDKGTIHDRMK